MEQSLVQNNLTNKIEIFLQKNPIVMQILRFAAIGVLNTALDFLILNFFTVTLNISSGLKLGGINVPGFVLAVIQSYFWNKYWTFDSNVIGFYKNFLRLILVGLLGFVTIVFVLLGSQINALPIFYLMLLLVFLVAEFALLMGFKLVKKFDFKINTQDNNFWSFILVSIIGLVINSIFLTFIATHILIVANEGLNKNLAKIIATGASLAWNFIGYKLFVFKK